ncbi:MAG: ATP-binding cassette domain-containing protein [Saprospiraceae bacterium]|nr:ATP-binding cassette domain-containing protein [Saprospiraceae bacterium]
MAHLEIKDLSKSFGRKQVLDGLELRLTAGEIVAVMGRNGSGKSTLFQILFGLIKANRGRVTIDGFPLTKRRDWVGYLPQYAFLPSRLRVRTLIQSSQASEEARDAIFYAPKISKIENHFVGQLSVGERRYLATLLLGHLQHPILLLDEPLSMLEPIQMDYIKTFLQGLKATKGVLLADHYYEDVLQTADRKLLLQDGKLQPVSNKVDLVQMGYLPKSRL